MTHGLSQRLDGTLRSISRLTHLQRLVRVLGHEVVWEPIPPAGWLGYRRWIRCIHRAAAVGRHGGFVWVAVETTDTEFLTRRIAERLALRGEHAGILALDVSRRLLAVSVSFSPFPVLMVDLADPSQLALHCLGRLPGMERAQSVAGAARLAKALEAAEPGREFIRKFRTLFRAFALELPRVIPERDRERLALLQLTRVLFLYFVQSRGWLNGQLDFLRLTVDRHLSAGADLHGELFAPLFFGTLNQPYRHRSPRARRFGKIPFLNGGLFERHWLERRYRVRVSNTLWRKAFDDVFERFHFTAREGGAGPAIAPDMLGRVFEGMMDPHERKRSGTYYTPAVLVSDLLEAAIGALLTTQLGLPAGATARRIHERDPSLATVTRTLTILDPAVGSGAFLLGAMEWLAAVHRDEGTPAAVRRRILEDNLFGVDTSAIAVSLTELRLWLAVLTEEQVLRAEAVRPLPNLDCLIRQGDSLSDPMHLVGRHATLDARASRLGDIRRCLIGSTGPDKQKQIRLLKRAERAAFERWLDEAEAALEHRLAECLAVGKSETLFGVRQGLDADLRVQVKRLRAERRHLREVRRRLRREREIPWFHYESQFADIFEKSGGFDLVVGNPPWIRAEFLPVVVRGYLARRFKWWTADGGRGFSHLPDLSLAFLERGLELARPQGAVAFLLPAKVATAAYGRRARQALADNTTLHAVADLTPTHARSFDATAYPLAIVASKGRAPPHHAVRSTLAVAEAVVVPQQTLRRSNAWSLASDGLHRALAEVHDHPTLGERLTCHLGVKTGANAVFLDPCADVEPELRRPALRGRDVASQIPRQRASIIWTHDSAGAPIEVLPPRARRYFARHADRLRQRADYRDGPPWQLFRVGPALATYKVVWADIARRLTAVALISPTGRQVVPLNTCYLVATPTAEAARSLASWLNSTYLRALAAARADRAHGGFARFNARVVSSLPLPPAVLTDHRLAAMSSTARDRPSARAAVDEVACRYLGLSSTAREALHAVAGIHADDRR